MTDIDKLRGEAEFMFTVPSGMRRSDAEPFTVSAATQARLDEFQRVLDRGNAEARTAYLRGIQNG